MSVSVTERTRHHLAELNMDYFKSLVPSQLVAERGAEIVVINPGSAHVRIGLASSQAPFTVTHCIAHHIQIGSRDGKEEAAGCQVKGAVGEQWCGTSSLLASRRKEREEVLEMVEMQLKLKPFFPEPGKAGASEGKNCALVPEDEDVMFSWTRVEDDAVVKELSPLKTQQSLPKSSSNCMPEGNELGANLDHKHEWTNAEVAAKETTENGMPERGSQRPRKFRKFICGPDSLRIAAGQPYCLRRPMCRGRLNVSNQYSLQQVCDDMNIIWDWVLTEKCNLTAKHRQKMSAVLVVPDTLDNREVKEMLTVILRDLQFRAAVVFQECVAATFGNGISSGCVVNMGAQVTSVMCIEEGVALPTTRLVLPFGGEDISRCLLWVQQQRQTWPSIDSNVLHDPLDFQMLNELKEAHCLITEGERRAVAEVRCRMAGQPTRVDRVSLSALNVPPMGLFYPALLAPEEYAPLVRPWYHLDYEDVWDDGLPGEAGRRYEASEAGVTNGNSNGTSISAGNQDGIPYKSVGNVRSGVEASSVGLPEAIVDSILSIGRVDLQKKLLPVYSLLAELP